MPTWLIIVIVALAILAIGGMIARAMFQKRTEAQFRTRRFSTDWRRLCSSDGFHSFPFPHQDRRRQR